MNNTQLNYRFKNVCFKNICFGIAALIAAIGYSVGRLDDCYREHVNQMPRRSTTRSIRKRSKPARRKPRKSGRSRSTIIMSVL